MKKIVLFHRDFQRFTGGHLKVWNYFNHVLASDEHEPRIAFSPESKFDATNPWSNATGYIVPWTPEDADVLFLAGKDWNAISPEQLPHRSTPIINLIQHPRHADPKHDLYQFLGNRAVRICVSQPTAQAIKATHQVNGPVVVIPNGIDLADLPERGVDQHRPIEVLICGLKAPGLARRIEKLLRQDENIAVTPLLDWLPRSEYLQQLDRSRIAVMLPRPSEGFYLPALEAMACGALVICPDCIGNRDFCIDAVNCFRPDYDAEGILAAIYRALGLPPNDADAMRTEADATVRQHSLERERAAFLKILNELEQTWSNRMMES
jgi:glycosyltransferase involved in cell wall biosynthesis